MPEGEGKTIGFVIIRVKPAREDDVYAALEELRTAEDPYARARVEYTNKLFGEYDMIAKVTADGPDALAKYVVNVMRAIDGIDRTMVLTGIEL